jgi:hypothetical protein
MIGHGLTESVYICHLVVKWKITLRLIVATLMTTKTVFYDMTLVDWFIERLLAFVTKTDVHYDFVLQVEEKEMSGYFFEKYIFIGNISIVSPLGAPCCLAK